MALAVQRVSALPLQMNEQSVQSPDGGANDPALKAAYRDLRRLSVFDGIPNDHLWHVIAGGGVKQIAVDRDFFIADPESVAVEPRIYFVVSGQVAIAVFDPALMAARKADQLRTAAMSKAERDELSLLRPPPLAREARKNLATFMEGDVFNSAALATGATGDVAFYSVSPAVVASIAHRAIAELCVAYPFFEQRLRRSVEIGRDRLRNIAGVKQEILDFFIRQGISVAGEMVRVRQLDSCIDCKLCEEACEARYGKSRLVLGGFQLGMLDFVFTCRTCTDQRCLDPCEYDSIKFDEEICEVVINETSCVGCTLCAQACPYAAIEMVDVEDPQNPTFSSSFKARLASDNALVFGPGTPRVARPRRIANKCDHCMNYGDQACVSACPTGSLIEIAAKDVFNERSPAAAALARAGFDQDVKLDHSEILPTKPFTRGVGVRNAGMAKVRRGRVGPVMLWGVALAAWVLALVEILLRIYKPTNSLQYALLRAADLEPVIAKLKVGFRAGSDLAIYCGYVGTVLMIIAIVYSPVRRIRAFRKIASNTMWFDFHMMAGTMGPAFIALHSAMKMDTWVAIPFWCMVIVVVSGVGGRYLYTQVPDLLNGRELEELDHQVSFGRYREDHGEAVRIAETMLENHRARAKRVGERARLLGAFAWIIMEDLRRPGRWFSRRRAFKKTGAPRFVWKDLAARTGRLMLFERRRVLVPRAQLLLHTWKMVHVPFSFIMAVISAVHIYLAWHIAIN